MQDKTFVLCLPGQSQGVGASQTIVAVVGEDVILPCRLEPAADVVSKSLEWGRPDLEPRFVHVWHEGQNLLVNQNPSYKGRTSLSIEKLRHGDLSLKLSAVKHSDNGIYRCYFPSQSKESTVELFVGEWVSVFNTHYISLHFSSSTGAGLMSDLMPLYEDPNTMGHLPLHKAIFKRSKINYTCTCILVADGLWLYFFEGVSNNLGINFS